MAKNSSAAESSNEYPTSIRWSPKAHAMLEEMANVLHPLPKRQILEMALGRLYNQWKKGDLDGLFSELMVGS
jgi:hypothetical protein